MQSVEPPVSGHGVDTSIIGGHGFRTPDRHSDELPFFMQIVRPVEYENSWETYIFLDKDNPGKGFDTYSY